MKTIASNKSADMKLVQARKEEVVHYAGRGYTEWRLPNGRIDVEIHRRRPARFED